MTSEVSEFGPRLFANVGLLQGIQIGKHWTVDVGIDQSNTLIDSELRQFDDDRELRSGSLNDDFGTVIDAIETFDASSLATDHEKLAFWMNAYNAKMIERVRQRGARTAAAIYTGQVGATVAAPTTYAGTGWRAGGAAGAGPSAACIASSTVSSQTNSSSSRAVSGISS